MKAETAEKLFFHLGWVYDFSKYATLVLALGLAVHYFFYSALVVRGASMEPNFLDGQVYLVDKISYRTKMPQRGDAVAMYFPGETERRFIKRIIGLPGDTIKISQGQVFINNNKLNENYLPNSYVPVLTQPEMEHQLVPGEYFVLGDNRVVSSDSRSWGTVPRAFLIGKVSTKILDLPVREPAELN